MSPVALLGCTSIDQTTFRVKHGSCTQTLLLQLFNITKRLIILIFIFLSTNSEITSNIRLSFSFPMNYSDGVMGGKGSHECCILLRNTI